MQESIDKILNNINKEHDAHKLYNLFKRIFDLILSILGIIALSPIFIIIAILIKLEDRKEKYFSARKEWVKMDECLRCLSLEAWFIMRKNLKKNF